jgi:hypothetical protein
MPTITADLSDDLDQKLNEYAERYKILKPGILRGPRPNRAEALRSILRKFFQLEETKKVKLA